jgi:hypothetical protein
MPTYVDTIICDDFRQEIGNKLTLNGVLGEEVYLPQIPTLLPSLTILQRWRVANEEIVRGVGQFSFALEPPDEKVQQFPPVPTPPIQKGVHVTMANFVLKFVGLPIRVKGEYKFKTLINGVEMNVYRFYVLPVADMQAAQVPQIRPVGFRQ